MPTQPPTVGLALQGGGSHGAFTWGVLDRLLQEVAAGRLGFAAISGTSAGAINAALTVSGLVQGGPDLARRKLADFWRALSRGGFLGGNALFFGEQGPFGFNLDWSPVAIALEAVGLVVSPYTNPFYSDALAPLIAQAFSAADLAALNAATEPRLFLTATDVTSNGRAIFTQPDISAATLRASACLPSEFKAVTIGGVPYWDGGYLGNPSLSPLLDHAQDLLLVLVNPFHRDRMPPHSAPAILDRLNEITFNASVVLEVNAIEAVNSLLNELAESDVPYAGRYKPIRIHAIRDDAFLEQLGFVSKNSTSWRLLSALRDAGYRTAEAWVAAHRDKVGKRSSFNVKTELTNKVLKAPSSSTRAM
ncbi:patatin-like phospholipase family protein [Rhodopila sp.]|uniref:patatin-like phospholipase family protein n=1 Tax=Rhodopila sp. TaxID=2480087 RepID=UPI003D104FCE